MRRPLTPSILLREGDQQEASGTGRTAERLSRPLYHRDNARGRRNCPPKGPPGLR